ncbi:gliding motility-associated C-terminal domain-containing protein [Muricauda sp. ANG21]|uniref:Ig-like domain-containing protein n=1 Tax=Allomuricauda sp. ANG21 TaxID=3042468 RepID=UPI003454C11B
MKKCLLFVIVLVSFQSLVVGQTFATTISSESEVDVSSNAIDGDLGTSADVRASTGILAGIGAYSGHLELEFSTPLNPNTTSYVKLDTEQDLLPYLLGGSLGSLLSDIGGVVLIGNQEFTVTAKNNDANILEESSSAVNAFSSDLLRVVADVNNDYFLAIAPNGQYNRLRLTNQIGSLIGLNNTRTLEVYGAFHSQGLSTCGVPAYTSFSGSGLTLDLLDVGGAGVTDPHLAIDSNFGTFSRLGLGILGVAASIEQTVYFDTPSGTGDNYYLTIAIDPSLLQAGIVNNIEVVAQSGSSAPTFIGNLSSLLSVDLLTLLESGQPATIGFDPGGAADRVTIRLSSLLNISLDQNIQLFEVYRAPAIPSIDPTSQDISICEGNTANLVATTTAGNELLWYDAETNGNLLDTVNSGEAFTTPILNTDTTYYVSARGLACPEESPRVAVTVNVVEIPTASDIDVSGDENPVCSSSDVVLVPSSAIDGDFSWYFDANATNEITDGLVVGPVTYTISLDGNLTINGLDQAGSPYSYYVGITEESAGCENAPGDLASATVDIVDSASSITITSNPLITLENLVDFFLGVPTYEVTGTVAGDAAVGDEVTLVINGQIYTGVLDANLDFNISVDGADLALDVDGVIDAFVSGTICTLTDIISVDIPELIIDDLVQVFCASDSPTLLDLVVNTNDISFFDSLDATTALDINTPLVDGTVYFAGILGIPISVLPRVGISVNLTDLPIPTTISLDQTFCADLNATIGDISVNQPNVVFYAEATGGTPLDVNTVLTDGESYYVALLDTEGCESTVRLRINITLADTEPITLSGQAEDACLEDQYTYSTETGKQNYMWTVIGGAIINGGTSSDDFVTVSWNSLQNTSVSVRYEDSMGCVPVGDTRLDVEVVDCGDVMGEEFCFEVYNEFSPNNDGFNDFFEIECIENYANTVQVFNRNGNKVFESVNYQNNWGGIANVGGILNKGEHLPSGTYYYVINIPELNRNLAGWLQLAR